MQKNKINFEWVKHKQSIIILYTLHSEKTLQEVTDNFLQMYFQHKSDNSASKVRKNIAIEFELDVICQPLSDLSTAGNHHGLLELFK